MQILLVVCLLVSANAAPAERSKRNILPGDPRYDPTGHHHHEEHEHHENEIETSKALQSDFGGSFPVPDTTYGIFGSTTGSPLGLSNYYKYDFGADFSGFSPEFVNIGGSKLVEQKNSVTESSVTPSKVVSVSIVEPSKISEATTPASVESVTPQDKGEENTPKAEVEEIEVVTESANDVTPSDTTPTSEKPWTVESRSAAVPSEGGFSFDSPSTPFESNFNFGSHIDSSFGSSIGQPSFGSGFESFDQSSFNPGFQSGINTNYEFFGNGGVNYPASFGSFPGFEQLPQHPVIDSQVAASFPQYNPVEFNKNVGYLPPFQGGFSAAPEAVTASPFPSLLSVTEAPTNFKFGSQQAYLSPIQEQQNIFKNYNPAPAKQSASVTIEKSIEPEIKINEGSFSGITQLTDENGGYIY